MMDVYLVPQVYNALRFELDTVPYPNIMSVWSRCCEHEAFAAAHPSAQPDNPE